MKTRKAALADLGRERRALLSRLAAIEAEVRAIDASGDEEPDEKGEHAPDEGAPASAAARPPEDEILTGMSHDLRTPLAAVLGISEALFEGVYGPLLDPQRRALERIEQSGRQLLRMIGEIVDLSRIDAGEVELQHRPVAIDELCRTSMLAIQEPARRKRLQVSFRATSGFTTLIGDEQRLEQILVNLLHNAVRAAEEGGSLGLEVSSDEPGDRVRFTVWDAVHASPCDEPPPLSQPFPRRGGGLTREASGTGVGLALVQQLVALHGGKVEVEDQAERGRRITVTLPRVHGHGRGERGSAAPPRSESARRPRALVVEDTPPVAEQLARYLAGAGLDAVTHGEGRRVVERAAAVEPRVILLDILLPVEVGWDVLRDLKADPRTAHIPVVVVSVLDQPEVARALGAAACLRKPVTREELLRVLGELELLAPARRHAI